MLEFTRNLIISQGIIDIASATKKIKSAQTPGIKSIKSIKSTTTFKNGLDKSTQINKIDKLLKLIDAAGIKRLGDNTDIMCQEFSHQVFYQSIEDDLKVVYVQIMDKLKEIYIRDKDALHFIRKRDWDTIEFSFSKMAKGSFTGLQIWKLFDWSSQQGRKYKQYNRAYYQEIIIKNDVEQRTQMLFKLKFL